MAAPKGIAAVEWLAQRTKAQRGGNDRRPDNFDRSAPDALALWRDAYLESLGARNYAAGTLEGRRDALESVSGLGGGTRLDTRRPNHPARSWKAISAGSGAAPRPTGSGLGWSTQRNRLGIAQGLLPLAHPAERHPAQSGQRVGTAPAWKSACRRKC